MREKRKQIVILAFILLLCLAPAASAIAIGVSPSSLNFQVRNGRPDKKTFQVSTNSQPGLPFRLEPSESISGMVKIEPAEKGIVDVKHAARINISATAPIGALPGNYTGFIIVTAAPGGAESSGSSVSTGVALRINVEIIDGAAEAAKVNAAAKGDAAAEAAPETAPAEDNVQKMEAGEPASAESETARIGNRITGNVAAAGGGVSSVPLISGVALASVIIVLIWIFIMMGANPKPKSRTGQKSGLGPNKNKRTQR